MNIEEFLEQQFKAKGYNQPWRTYFGGTKPDAEQLIIQLLVDWEKMKEMVPQVPEE
jgi:hypothetical protein